MHEQGVHEGGGEPGPESRRRQLGAFSSCASMGKDRRGCMQLVKSMWFRARQVSRFGLAVRRQAGKQKGLGSIPLRLSLLFRKVVVCGHCLVTLSLTINKTLKWLSSLLVLMQESFRW